MTGRDRKRELHELYSPPLQPVLIDVPELAFIAVDGVGAPEEDAEGPTTDFQLAIGALYPVAYTLKFTMKRELGLDSTVMPLEALWYAGEGGLLDPLKSPAEWTWRAMIAVPDEVTEAMVERAVGEVRPKHPSAMLDRLRFERWREGLAVQVMHLGPYAAERATIERLLAFASDQGLVPHGAHHEIYLGDPRRAAPEKLRTALRQPVERTAVLAAVG